MTWNGAIASGSSVTITITAAVNAGTQGNTISNQGTVFFDSDGNGTNESTVATDDPTVPGTANATSLVVRFASVTATKTVSVPSKAVGATVVCTITLSNSGDGATIDNVGHELIDTLPSGATLVSASASTGSLVATVTTNTAPWNGGIPAAGNVVIAINAIISSTGPGSTVRDQATSAFDADLNGSHESTGVTDDPSFASTADATAFAVDALIVPTLSDCAWALLALMLLGWGTTRVRRARRA